MCSQKRSQKQPLLHVLLRAATCSALSHSAKSSTCTSRWLAIHLTDMVGLLGVFARLTLAILDTNLASFTSRFT